MRRAPSFHLLVCVLLATATAPLTPHAYAQEITPVVHTLFQTDTPWVNGIVEPASGRFVLYSTGSGIARHDARSGKTTTIISGPTYCGFGNGLSLSRSGRRLVFTRLGEDKRHPYIWIADLDSLGEPVASPHRVSLAPAVGATISPDGRWIALAAIDGDNPWCGAGNRLLVIPSTGGDARVLDSAATLNSPHWSPDGKWIAYRRNNAIVRIPATGGRYDSLAVGFGVVDISPDSRYIAVGAPWGGALGIGENIRPTVGIYDTLGAFRGRYPVWFAQTRTYFWSGHGLLAFHATDEGVVKSVSLTTGAARPYGYAEPYSVSVQFSPDGSTSATVVRMGGRNAFVIRNLRSGSRKIIRPDAEPFGGSYQWSPDGREIAFKANSRGSTTFDLYAMNVSTGAVTRLTRGLPVCDFKWRSDSRAVTFVSSPVSPLHIAKRADIRSVGLDGKTRVLRTIVSETRSLRHPWPNILNDTLISLTTPDSIMVTSIAPGPSRTIYRGRLGLSAFTHPTLSPDGVWLGFTIPNESSGEDWVLVPIRGGAPKHLGTIGCNGHMYEWLPNTHQILGWGAESCDQWVELPYLLDADGAPPRVITHEASEAYVLMPGGRDLLMIEDGVLRGSIEAVDVSSALRGARQAGGPRPTGGK